MVLPKQTNFYQLLNMAQKNISKVNKIDIREICEIISSERYTGSSRSEIFREKSGLKNFSKFTGKHLCQSLSFNKTEILSKKRLGHRCFPVNFEKFLRTPIFIEHLWWLLLIHPRHRDVLDIVLISPLFIYFKQISLYVNVSCIDHERPFAARGRFHIVIKPLNSSIFDKALSLKKTKSIAQK